VKKLMGFFICFSALLMPGRIRVIFSEILGWITQFLYMNYFAILKYIINELNQSEEDKNKVDIND
jgi:hypothetical protein